jgi:hypothetical protein
MAACHRKGLLNRKWFLSKHLVKQDGKYLSKTKATGMINNFQIILDGLVSRYKERVPDVSKILQAMLGKVL